MDDLYKSELDSSLDKFNPESNAIRGKKSIDGGADLSPIDIPGIDPNPVEEPEKALPTFTVKSDGELHIPTPQPPLEIDFENEIEPTKHRFEPAAVKTALDSVTYIGFVDFTTTIDDTVVIFRPKKSFRTDSRAVFLPKIEATQTSSFDRINEVKPSKSPKIIPAPPKKLSPSGIEPETEPELPRSQAKSPKPKNLKDLFQTRNKNRSSFSPFQKQKSSVTSSKGAIETSSVTSFESIRPSQTSSNRFGGRPTVNILSRPQQSPNLEQDFEIDSSTKAPEVNEIHSSLDQDNDVELVYKTLYTTYTYFTTFFRASSTRVKSREDVISNVVTLTNILGPSDLAKLKSSCQVDKTCQFISSTAAPSDFTDGFIGRPNFKSSQAFINEEPKQDKNKNNVVDNGVFKTFYTTYTYFTTLFIDGGESSISTRTEIYSNVQSNGVQVDATEAPRNILPQISSSVPPALPISAEPPARRLEYSSIARGISLNKQLTTTSPIEDLEDLEADATTEEIGALRDSSLDQVDGGSDLEPAQSLEGSEDYDDILQADEVQIDASSIAPSSAMSSVKTFYTTYTYFTTLFRNGTSYVTSNLETVTNTADATASPTLGTIHKLHLQFCLNGFITE